MWTPYTQNTKSRDPARNRIAAIESQLISEGCNTAHLFPVTYQQIIAKTPLYPAPQCHPP